jgi:ubiquinone/menaquinone biosynthesis C-methylase UbiE
VASDISEIVMALPSYAMKQPSFPEMYEQYLAGPLFRPWAEIALEDVRLAPGDTLLDIACGTGIVARIARERLGDAAHIVGVDVSADMLAVARAVAPDIDWRAGNAADLPLRENEQFDVVVCQQGLQFFPDKRAAAAEMRQALKDGGRLAVLTWRSDSEIPLFRELRDVAERHLGPIADQRHSFGDSSALEALFRDAGFGDARSRTISRTIRFDDGAPFLRMNAMALVGMSAGGKTMTDADRERVLETIIGDSAPVLRRYSDGPALAFELSTNLLTATAR